MRCNTPTPVREAGHRGSQYARRVFAAARGCISVSTFVVSFYESILDTHSLRRTPTNSYCVRESATPPTASPCKPENAETGEPPNGPSKLYTLNVSRDASGSSYTQRSTSGQTNVGCPRARERVCITPQGPVTVAEINSRL